MTSPGTKNEHGPVLLARHITSLTEILRSKPAHSILVRLSIICTVPEQEKLADGTTQLRLAALPYYGDCDILARGVLAYVIRLALEWVCIA